MIFFLIPCPALNNHFPLDLALYIPCPALNNPLPVNKDAPKLPSKIGIKGKAAPFLYHF